jgi:hypothetical protein
VTAEQISLVQLAAKRSRHGPEEVEQVPLHRGRELRIGWVLQNRR